MRTRVILVILFLLIVMTGCGKTSNPTAQAAATDRATGRNMVLVKSDIPEGWTDSGVPPDNAQAQQLDKEVNSCIGLPDPATIDSARVNGSTFTMLYKSISTSVDFLTTDALIRQDLAGNEDPKNLPCIAKIFDTLIAQANPGAVSSSSTISSLPGLDPGPNAFADRITTRVQLGEIGTATEYVDLIGLAKGRAKVSLTIFYTYSAPPVGLEKSLLAKLQVRLAQATTV